MLRSRIGKLAVRIFRRANRLPSWIVAIVREAYDQLKRSRTMPRIGRQFHSIAPCNELLETRVMQSIDEISTYFDGIVINNDPTPRIDSLTDIPAFANRIELIGSSISFATVTVIGLVGNPSSVSISNLAGMPQIARINSEVNTQLKAEVQETLRFVGSGGEVRDTVFYFPQWPISYFKAKVVSNNEVGYIYAMNGTTVVQTKPIPVDSSASSTTVVEIGNVDGSVYFDKIVFNLTQGQGDPDGNDPQGGPEQIDELKIIPYRPTITIDPVPTQIERDNNTFFGLQVHADHPVPENITFNLATRNGTAVVGSDFVALNKQYTILKGQTTPTELPVFEIIGNDVDEADIENFFIDIVQVTPVASARFPNAPSLTIITVDDDADIIAPSTTSIVRLSPSTSPTNADDLVFRVTFSEPVANVDAADFVASGPSASRSVTAVSTTIYDVTLSGGNLATFNGVVGLNLNSPSINDLTGNALPNTEPPLDETYLVDNTAPTILSIRRLNPPASPTNADIVTFRVTFSETVTRVEGDNVADFVVSGTTATVTLTEGVSGSNGTQYDVTVSGGNLATLVGTVGLDLAAGQNIIDAAGNSLPLGEPGIDETYSVDNELQVASLVPTSTGFVAEFNRQVGVASLNLYDQGGLLGAADVLLAGDNFGEVRGSLVVDPELFRITFIKTSGVLAPDNYTVTIRSGANAFRTISGQLLDGNRDGTTGDDFIQSFVVAAPAANAVTASLPNFARGYGQPVNLPANVETAGLPLTLSTGSGLSNLSLELHFDPTLLDLSAFALSSDVAARGGTAQLTFPSAGRVILTVNSTGTFAAAVGSFVLGSFTARVPDDAAYGGKQILDITNLHVFANGAGLNEVPAIDVDAIHVAAYFGDTNGSKTYNSPDTTLIRRIIGQVNTGLSAYPLADPVLLADITLNGVIQSADTTSIRRVIGQVPVANVPALPTGLIPPPNAGADPRIFIPQTLTALPGGTVTVPVKIEVTEPAGITLSGFDVAIQFDSTKFEVNSAQLGSLFVGADLSGTLSQPVTGTLIFSADSSVGSRHFDLGTIGNLFTVTLTVKTGAAIGGSSLNLLASTGTTLTALFDNSLNDLILIPSPTNNVGDTVDGLLTVIPPDSIPPTVTSVVRLTPAMNPTNSDILTFRVTFGETVTGVDAADFDVSGTNAMVTAANGVSGSSGTQYDVNVAGGDLASLNGTVELNLAAGQSIVDLAGNPLSITEPTEHEFFIIDNTHPVVTVTPNGTTTNVRQINFTFQFTESVTGFEADDITVTNGVSGIFTAIDGDTYMLQVTPIADGMLFVSVNADAASDSATNGNLQASATVVSNVNDPTVISLTLGATTTLSGKRIAVDSGALVQDPDSVILLDNRIVVSIKAGQQSPDQLRLIPHGKGMDKLKLVRGLLKLGKLAFGTATGGKNGQPLVLTFTADVDATLVQRVVRAIGFQTHKANPGIRQIEFQAIDSSNANASIATKTIVVGHLT